MDDFTSSTYSKLLAQWTSPTSYLKFNLFQKKIRTLLKHTLPMLLLSN